ncbi:hypothetical protein Val02_41230 [Virgisporangium aliadipatigenens]|uniref:Uncharacterized protein n=1 Tax=Virgisporangium aliadipatigenens TaxID=741659 RepID=A0A8J3YMR3_9ACTN|nr:hypothetical protein [Virgisporangium aliadipatigenens]GIJ47237.1 hypothetical protein Val02_41230 [Virgisporangium aliadipatigenens]
MGATYRQCRLARGWEPVQLIGRLKIEAARDGLVLPQTWQMIRLVFLWENNRVPVPGLYATLFERVLGNVPDRRGRTNMRVAV